jgi:hypothetical protein
MAAHVSQRKESDLEKIADAWSAYRGVTFYTYDVQKMLLAAERLLTEGRKEVMEDLRNQQERRQFDNPEDFYKAVQGHWQSIQNQTLTNLATELGKQGRSVLMNFQSILNALHSELTILRELETMLEKQCLTPEILSDILARLSQHRQRIVAAQEAGAQ